MLTIKDKSLPQETINIIRHQATERPGTGAYNALYQQGSYLCRACGTALFRADSKFSSGCGWPSFDVAIPHALEERSDSDGMRTEIICKRCMAHLGHVFDGEGFTQNNRRFCVNSQSLDFVTSTTVVDSEEIIVAGGCFWGVQYYFDRLAGVLKTEVGYTGGHVLSPSYQQVCSGNTGHYEAIRVVFDAKVLSLEAAYRYFFEIHDPYQSNGQGPDLGFQYKSAVFYYDDKQKQIAEALMHILAAQRGPVATTLHPVSTFWKAEPSHQQYYETTHKAPYCHQYTQRFL